ncbi:DNA-binding transcriptional regulator, XRE family [Chitinophaga sp. CF118]|uniref:helix-turn-helix domain-containing protein n=1 Tax=Chitinophaga sp. CF118 TaxID=1884367 RepID=UPI0008F3DA6F|nr:helix-turn-helix transcriptional regulator [Chitinophaga sp. CF118]SFD84351.1 DNA-binding transcriptional regulator, XRE family [Chitinophaga sp. CF118]
MNLNEKLKGLASAEPSNWKNEAAQRIATEGWRKKSFAIAVRILDVLHERKMNQSMLAELMGVSRQQVSKIVNGNENLTFETIHKLETALNINLIKIEEENTQSVLLKSKLHSSLQTETLPVNSILKTQGVSKDIVFPPILIHPRKHNKDEYITYEVDNHKEP